MGWKIVAVSEAPLGTRTLRIGNTGKDVLELQQLLSDTGFYCGKVDGFYGILTEEAVTIFQRSFNLKSDGMAGPKLLTTLKAASMKLNRIIYTVRPKENLKSISRKFGVSKPAWQTISGQGNPLRKVYPGMRLILNQKVVICAGKKSESLSATAGLEIGWELDDNGELVRIKTDDNAAFQTLVAKPEIWKKFLSSSVNWEKVAVTLKPWPTKHWGIDFRNAPLETIFRWKDLLYYLCKVFSIKQVPFIAISAPNDDKAFPNRLFRLNLPKICDLAKLIMIEPFTALDSPSVFLKSGTNLAGVLREICRFNLGLKTLLMGEVGGFDWNLDQRSHCRRLSFREARLLTAMNHRSVKYDPETTNTIVNYLSHRERHCLIFRDQQGWQDWIKVGLRANLLGFVFNNPKDWGKFGNELFNSSFGVIPEEKI